MCNCKSARIQLFTVLILNYKVRSIKTYYCHPTHVEKGNPILTFAMAVGHTVNTGLSFHVVIGAVGAMLLLSVGLMLAAWRVEGR